MPFGATELLILLAILLLVFGARRLPELGRSMGTGLREFKDSVSTREEPRRERRSELDAPSQEAEEEERPARAAAEGEAPRAPAAGGEPTAAKGGPSAAGDATR